MISSYLNVNILLSIFIYLQHHEYSNIQRDSKLTVCFTTSSLNSFLESKSASCEVPRFC
ncbi:Hypothetical protein PP7435_CHR3-1292 [Komagataella phaffii CBS 7435]|uniref:Uncharacterized protein n=1 Tax=Komagataella phaffii (strain ATCC 76273 / CBS 7435 / CECT 11047 / NRRL Y-11430 / Wegner 21-1) TaxID=981350 RepID=A0A1G4KQ67_KOMPC|nr:Hypothetical protein BQ9382_C3-0182 [Komagataella phaffii CBS 7435]SCV12140.1 Hypothetical protein PP7435_CHR3-1292 [Komagataella phaffii CBS 7435]